MKTLPYLNFASWIRSLNIYFILRQGNWRTCSGGSFIMYGLVDMMLVTCEPLEGEFSCLYKDLTSGRHFVKAQGHLDLHLGLESHKMDDAPLILGHLGQTCFLWRHLGIPCMLFSRLTIPNIFPLEGLHCTSGV
jgi:hypothetical protein